MVKHIMDFQKMALIGLWLLASHSLAQTPTNDDQQDPLYVTATVWERALNTTTASVSRITKADIAQQDARTLGDILPFLPGFTVTSQGSRGGLTTANIRGGDPNFTLVLLDGMPLNDPTYQQGDVFDLAGLSLQGIERIEVVRGPLSSFYGSTGLSGVIHLISTKAMDQRLQARVSAGDGSYSHLETSVSTALLQGTQVWSVGFEEENALIAAESFEQLSIKGRIHLPLDDHRALDAQLRYSDWESQDYPDASGGPLAGSGDLRDSDHREWNLGLSYSFGKRIRQKLDLMSYQHQLDRNSPAVWPMVPPSAEDTRFRNLRLGWQGQVYADHGWQLDIGADHTIEAADNQSLLLLPPEFGGSQSGDYNQRRSRTGVLGSLSYSRNAWFFELMTRLDVLEGSQTETNPRFGLRFDPTQSPWGIHASVGRAFKQPSFFAMASPRALGGNPDLESETSVGADLGIFYQNPKLTVKVTGFHSRMKNLVDFDFASFLHINRAEVEAQGIEFALNYRPSSNLNIQLNATYQDVKDPNSDVALRHRPDWSGGLRLSWQIQPSLNLNLDGRHVAEFYDQQLPVNDRFRVGSHTLWGMTAGWQMTEDWHLKLRTDNLSNRSYETLIGHPGPGRTYRLGLGYAM